MYVEFPLFTKQNVNKTFVLSSPTPSFGFKKKEAEKK